VRCCRVPARSLPQLRPPTMHSYRIKSIRFLVTCHGSAMLFRAMAVQPPSNRRGPTTLAACGSLAAPVVGAPEPAAPLPPARNNGRLHRAHDDRRGHAQAPRGQLRPRVARRGQCMQNEEHWAAQACEDAYRRAKRLTRPVS